MASPLKPGKQSVDLATGVRVSRIRRDPPPKVKKEKDRDPGENERLEAVVGIGAFAIALMIILLGVCVYYV